MTKPTYAFHFKMEGKITIEADTVDEANAKFIALTKAELADHPDTELEVADPVEIVAE